MEEKCEVEATPHPLENFPVLKALFQCDLGLDSLKRNRLVSKSWLRACAKRWEQADKYPILDYYSGPCTPAIPGGNGMSLGEFYDQFQAGVSHVVQMVTSPRSHGKLTLCRWRHLKEEMSPIDHWFRTSPMFQWVKRLTLSNCRFSKEVWVFQKTFLKEVQNLEELTLKTCVVEESALEALRVANQQWMQYEDRANWLQAQRERRMTSRNAPYYYPKGYQHQKLTCLEVSLSQVEGQRAIRFWGPLLAMLPNLSSLKVRGYGMAGAEAGELPPLELTPFTGDSDAEQQREQGWGPVVLANLAEIRREYDPTTGMAPPAVRGYFWELFWFHEIGQVANTLTHLDLLDFSQRAQDYGVFSTVEFASTERNLMGQGNVYLFSQLTSLAIDLGLNPLFAERDLRTLNTWTPWSNNHLKELVLYRAPFATANQIPRYSGGLSWVQRLELWGNVSNSLDFLMDCLSITEFSWNTTCYEDKWKGQRIHHLLRGQMNGRRANPLHKTDLVEAANWEGISQRLPFNRPLRLTRWEMDWRMELQSWRKLAGAMPNLTWLKGVVVGDEQLGEVVSLWPGLEVLEMQHGSRVTVEALGRCLGKLGSLKKFKWRGCPCTQKLFGEKGINGEIILGELYKDEIEMELPWEDETTRDYQNSSGEKVCIQAAFESALLTGNSEEFFNLVETKV